MLAIPLCILFEIGIVISALLDKFFPRGSREEQAAEAPSSSSTSTS
jgi:Sec-independent protein secretion pathway component TatC